MKTVNLLYQIVNIVQNKTEFTVTLILIWFKNIVIVKSVTNFVSLEHQLY